MKKVFTGALLATMLCTAVSMGADEPTVVATGHATLKQRPEILRLMVLVTSQGDDPQGAMKALSQRRDQLKKEMVSLGADESSISFSEPTSAEQLTPQQRQMQMVLAAQGHKPTTQASGVNISCELTAEWPIHAASADDAFIAAGDLQQKIKPILAEGASKKAKTPEEQEIAEEMAGADQSQNAAKPDEPKFIFVHKLTDADQADMVKRAFVDATAEAQRLATAAGKTLGAVRQISTGAAAADATQNVYMDYIEEMTGSGNNVPPKPGEASGDSPGGVTANVSVSVTFALK